MKKLRIIDLDTIDYDSAKDIMSAVRNEVEHGADDTLILLEHNPVVTIGSDGDGNSIVDASYIKECGIPVIHIDRGGGAVVHNNGQLVAYPVMKVQNMPVDLLACIVETMADVVAEFNVKPKKGEEPGLWVGDRKIGFVGMKIQNNVSTHGFAINVSNDLNLFKTIRTCGVENAEITNLVLSIKKIVSMDMVKHVVISRFSRRFDYLPDRFIFGGKIA